MRICREFSRALCISLLLHIGLLVGWSWVYVIKAKPELPKSLEFTLLEKNNSPHQEVEPVAVPTKTKSSDSAIKIPLSNPKRIRLSKVPETSDKLQNSDLPQEKSAKDSQQIFQLNHDLRSADGVAFYAEKVKSRVRFSRDLPEIENDIYGNKNSLQALVSRALPLTKIASVILGQMTYPNEFVEGGIEGEVTLNLQLGPHYKLLSWEKPQGVNVLLNAFVVVNMLKLFQSGQLRFKTDPDLAPFTVSLNFQFRTQAANGQLLDKSVQIIDPSIKFKFVHYRDPALILWMNEYFPIVPIPGGVMLNVGAIIKIIQNWDKASPETQRERVLTLMQQQLEQEEKNIPE